MSYAGVLEIQMAADMINLKRDMEEAKSIVQSATDRMTSAAGMATKALGAIGVGLSVGAIGAWAEKVIDAAGNLHDLATRTGSAVEELSRFQEIGRTSGTTADAIAGAMDKLAKNTALVDDESKLAGVALKGMGIDFDTFKKMKPDEQMMAVAKALDEYEDGSAKSAVAMGIFGKEGAKLLPFLKDLARDTGTSSKVTKEQAENADALADKFVAWKAHAEGVAASYLLDLLPVLDKMTGLIVPLVTATGLYFGLFVGVPALFGAAKLAFDAAMLSLSGMGTAAATATTQMGLLTAAAGVLVGAVAGWQIGKYLRENFLEAQLAGIAFVEATMLGWERVQYVAQRAWIVIETAWGAALSGMGGIMSTFLQGIAGGLGALGLDAAAEKMLAWSGKVKDATAYSGDLTTKLAALKGDYERNRDAVKDVTGAMADDAIQAFKSREENDKSGKSLKDLAGQVDLAKKALKDKEAQDKLTEAGAKANKEETERQDKAYKDLTEKVQAQILKMQAEEDQGVQLSAAQKLAMEVTRAVKDGVGNMTAARQAEIEKMSAQMLKLDEAKEAAKHEAEAIKFTREERERATEQVRKHAEKLEEQARKIEEENTAIGLTKAELDKLRLQRLEEEARVAQAIVDVDTLLGYYSDETAAHEATIESLKRLHKATEDQIYLKAAKEAKDAWEKSAKSIGDGLEAAFFRAFESGGNFFSNLWKGIKDVFKNEVLTPIIKDVLTPFKTAASNIFQQLSQQVISPIISAVINPITGSLGLGSIGSSATAATGGGASGGLGIISSLASLGSTIAGTASAFGSAMSAGFTIGSSAIAPSLTMIGTASSAGTMAAGIGQLIGSAGPYALAAIAAIMIAKKLFGSKGGPKESGGYMSGGFTGMPVSLTQDGNVLGGDASTIGQVVEQSYASYVDTLGGTKGNLGVATFIARDPKGTANTQFVLDATMGGSEIYSRNNRSTGGNIEDVGRDPQQLVRAVAEAQTAALVAALKASTYTDTTVAGMVAALDAGVGAEAVSAEIARIAKYKKDQEPASASTDGSTASTVSAIDASNAAAMGSLSADYTQFLALQGRTSDAAELTAARLIHLQDWLYDSATSAANFTRQAIYEAAANDTVTRNSITPPLLNISEVLAKLLQAVYDQTAQVVPAVADVIKHTGRTSDALVGLAQGNGTINTRVVV